MQTSTSPFSNIQIGNTSIFNYKPKGFLKSHFDLFNPERNHKTFFTLCLLDLKGKISESKVEDLIELIRVLKPLKFEVIKTNNHYNVILNQ